MFKDAKLKIKRANQHVQELAGKLDAFLKTEFCRLHIEQDADTGKHHLKFEVTKPTPEDIPLVLGDALQNLHSALDFVTFEIVSGEPNARTKYLKFPVTDTRDELIARFKNGEIQQVGPDIMSLICDVIQPYKGGHGQDLVFLHNLNIMDKHFACIPVVSVAALTHVNGKAAGATFRDCTFEVGEGGVVNILGMPGPFTFQGHGQPAFAVLFGKGEIFEGQAIVPTLHQLSQLIAGIVQAIEKAYLARTQGAGHTPPTGSHPPTT